MENIFDPNKSYLAIIGSKYIRIGSVTFYPAKEITIQSRCLFFDYEGKTYGFRPDDDGIFWRCFREEERL